MELACTLWLEDDEWVMLRDEVDDPDFICQTIPYENSLYGEFTVKLYYRPEQGLTQIWNDELSVDQMILSALIHSYLWAKPDTFGQGIPDETPFSSRDVENV